MCNQSRMVCILLRTSSSRATMAVSSSLTRLSSIQPIAPTATITNPAAVGAAAQLGADSKRRQYADENLYRLVPLSMEAHGFIDSPAVRFLRDFATSTSSYSGSLGECLRDLNRALWQGSANLPCAANHFCTVSGSEPRLGLGFRSLRSVTSPHSSFKVFE